MEDDGELLELWSRGDNAAGRRLFERHYSSVYRFFNTKMSAGIEDLVQDTFAACVAGRDRLAAATSFRAYLYGTARNILRQHFRKARVRGVVIDLDNHSVHDVSPSPVTFVVEKAEHRLLIEALRRLPIDDQVAFELYYWERLTAGEMSEILGVSEKGVRSRLHRGKQLLRAIMEEVAASPELLASTLTNLEGWAAQVRDVAGPPT